MSPFRAGTGPIDAFSVSAEERSWVALAEDHTSSSAIITFSDMTPHPFEFSHRAVSGCTISASKSEDREARYISGSPQDAMLLASMPFHLTRRSTKADSVSCPRSSMVWTCSGDSPDPVESASVRRRTMLPTTFSHLSRDSYPPLSVQSLNLHSHAAIARACVNVNPW